jgi:hypothetical protein
MKRWMLVLLVLVVAAAAASAQVDFSAFEGAFQDFADVVADNLASTATSGLAWSPAHIGQFPHLGLGLTVGATMMPYEVVKPVLDVFAISLPSELDFLQAYGVPLPAATIDARIGGFGIPFDIGLKIGFIPEQVKALMGDVQADYLIVGGDIRFAILQDKGLVPGLSIGVGYSYLKGGIQAAGLLGGPQQVDVSAIMGNPDGTNFLDFSDPAIDFTWQSHVIEAKVQLSKNLLIFTPHVGVGAAYALSSSVGGGLLSTVTASGPNTLAEIQAAFDAAGKTPPTDQGLTVSADAPAGWAVRLFGGTSINLWLLRLDLDANWNVLTGAYGGNVNFRFQM